MSLRVSRLNRRILFNPLACVDHVGAPQVRGRRFDPRYTFFAAQNHSVMLQRNFGWSSPLVWRFLGVALAEAARNGVRRVGGAFLQFGAVLLGLACGFAKAAISSRRRGRGPVRIGSDAAELVKWLSKRPSPAIAASAA
jgi:hypothetical protein